MTAERSRWFVHDERFPIDSFESFSRRATRQPEGEDPFTLVDPRLESVPSYDRPIVKDRVAGVGC